ncbi:MAG: hypothetical protein ACTSRI_09900 [Promethearchaeota archaeon]
MENTELFQGTSNLQFNPIILEQLTQNTKKIIKLQELTLERIDIINEMNNLYYFDKKIKY